jgi:hypothetical protein
MQLTQVSGTTACSLGGKSNPSLAESGVSVNGIVTHSCGDVKGRYDSTPYGSRGMDPPFLQP